MAKNRTKRSRSLSFRVIELLGFKLTVATIPLESKMVGFTRPNRGIIQVCRKYPKIEYAGLYGSIYVYSRSRAIQKLYFHPSFLVVPKET
jgi:hypothetical protein